MKPKSNYIRNSICHSFIANADTILDIYLDNMHTCTSSRSLERLLAIPDIKPLTVCILTINIFDI